MTSLSTSHNLETYANSFSCCISSLQSTILSIHASCSSSNGILSLPHFPHNLHHLTLDLRKNHLTIATDLPLATNNSKCLVIPWPCKSKSTTCGQFHHHVLFIFILLYSNSVNKYRSTKIHPNTWSWLIHYTSNRISATYWSICYYMISIYDTYHTSANFLVNLFTFYKKIRQQMKQLITYYNQEFIFLFFLLRNIILTATNTNKYLFQQATLSLVLQCCILTIRIQPGYFTPCFQQLFQL